MRSSANAAPLAGSTYVPEGIRTSWACTPPAETLKACGPLLRTVRRKPAYWSLTELPSTAAVPDTARSESTGTMSVITFTSPPMVLGPYRMLAGPRTTSTCDTPMASSGVACAGSYVAMSPVRRPFSRTSTRLSDNPRRIGREGAAPLPRTVTPGRSESLSAMLAPALLMRSSRERDSADWYCSSAVRGEGEAETTISSIGIARSTRSNEVAASPSFISTRFVAEAWPITEANTRYVPLGTRRNANAPSCPVCATRSSSRRRTVAPGSGCPEHLTVPESVCAPAAEANERNATSGATARNARIRSRFMEDLPWIDARGGQGGVA